MLVLEGKLICFEIRRTIFINVFRVHIRFYHFIMSCLCPDSRSIKANYNPSCTARQLYGITLLMSPFCPTVGWNLCQCQYKVPLSNFSRPPDNFYGWPSLMFSPSQLSFSGVSVTVENMFRFSGLGLHQRGVSRTNYWGVTRRQLKSPTRDSSSLTHGLHGHLLKMNISKEGRAPLRIMRWKMVLSASMIKVELIRRRGHIVFVCIVQGRLVAAGYCSRHPDRCPKLTPDHRRRHRMLTPKH